MRTILMNATSKSVLIIGATGGLGIQCLRHLAQEPSVDRLHVFCRNPAKLSRSDKGLCDSIVLGDARIARDVRDALEKTQANYVILATGDGSNTGETDTRQATGEAFATVMKKSLFQHVKAIVVSSTGAGDSKIVVGLGVGCVISYHLRHVLADHTLQEEMFADLMDRTLVIRPTSLTNNKPGKKLVEFGNAEKAPSTHVNRSDIAAWITREVAKSPNNFRGGKLNITSAK